MSENFKKEVETKELLEEAEDLSIGSGAGIAVNLNPGTSIISSAMPPINHLTLRGTCGIVLTKDMACKKKILY